ncbi:hypothetical protein Tco_0977181 [Tanacetum coccineum]|uniref:Retrotransposon gag domain-containing protein n=1 Tax=Tanacetum coccineum TaxID=301880 RepID=A0ABQ5EJE7_9ASTR
MGDENPIRTLRDYSKPGHKGYRNTLELLVGNNVVPLGSDTIRLVQNGCSFHGLQSEDLNQYLKDFLKLVHSVDLDVANRERTRLHLFQFSIREQASNWLERLSAGSISTWEDLTNRESFSKAWTRFKDLLQKVLHHGIDLWHQVQIFYDYVNPSTRRTIDQLTGGKLRDRNAKESRALLEDLALYENENEAGGKCFTFKPKQINLGDTYNPSWKNHPNLRWKQPQNPHNNFSNPPNRFQPNGLFLNRSFNNNPQNFKNQSNIEGLVSNFMASQDARLSKFEADFKQQQGEMTNKIDTVLKAITDLITRALPSDTVKNLKLNVNSTSPILSARSYLMEDPQCSTRTFSSINTIIICPKQPNKSRDDKSEEEGRKEEGNPENINTTPTSLPDPSISLITEKVHKLNSFLESSDLVPRSLDTKFVCTKDDGDIMFIEIIRKYDDSHEEGPEDERNTTIE